MMRISWKDKVNNEEVKTAGTKRMLIYDLRMRQLSFLGHVMGKGDREKGIMR